MPGGRQPLPRRAPAPQAAVERRLLEPAPLPISWSRSALPVASAVGSAVASERFTPLPDLRPVTGLQLLHGGRDELHAIGEVDELDIAPLKPDGSLRPYTTIWVVPVGDDLYVRSYRGPSGSWFRDSLQRHQGRIRAGGAKAGIVYFTQILG